MKFFLGLLAAGILWGQTSPPNTTQILSPSTEMNRFLPAWMTFSGQFRARFEGYSGGGYAPNSTDDYLLTQLQLSLSIHPTPWLKLFAQGMDARSLEKSPEVPPYQNTWDIRQGWIELGDIDKAPVSIRVGRQELTFGDQRLVGSSPWTNAMRVFDAVRAVGRYRKLRLDVFSASVVNPVSGTWDHHQQGNNLHGAYGVIESLAPYIVIEPYTLWRLQHGLKNESGVVSKLNEKVGGLRIAGKLPRGIDYGLEAAREFGSLGSDKIQSWAGHWVVGRTWTARFSPRTYGEYNYAGGDKYPKDGIRGTFDQLYPSNHDKYGFADQVGWKNVKDLRAGLETKPRTATTLNFEYNNWYLASATDALYNATGAAVVRSLAGTAGTHVGQEIDITSTWAVAKPVTLGAGIGHIFPGEFLKNTTKGNPYTYPYMMATWKF